MLKKHAILFIFCICLYTMYGQITQRYTIADEKDIKSLDFTFFSPIGESFFTAVDNSYIVKIHGDFQEGKIRSNLKKSKVNDLQKVHLDLTTVNKSSSLFDIFSSQEDLYNRWNVYFSKHKKINLQLIYGYGKSYLDLAGLSVQKLKIITSGAKVISDYSVYTENPIKMDSLHVIAELGKVRLNNMHLYDVEYVQTTIDFGTVDMDFSKNENDYIPINAVIGAGTFTVKLPKDKNVPVQIKISSTLLSTIQLPPNYKKVSEGVYQNKAYKHNKGLNFEIQVSFGKVLFE